MYVYVYIYVHSSIRAWVSTVSAHFSFHAKVSCASDVRNKLSDVS